MVEQKREGDERAAKSQPCSDTRCALLSWLKKKSPD
jgi:hypothetical protein